MSIEERLRAGLEDHAAEFAPRVEETLDRVRVRGRRYRAATAALGVAASAAAVAAIAGAVVALDGFRVGSVPPANPANRSSATASDPATDPAQAALYGTLTAEIDDPGVLAGRWRLRLDPDGNIDVSPPTRFRQRLDGAAYTSDASTFRTILFGSGLCADHGSGIYTWIRVGPEVVFRTVSDTCPARERFFADSTWTVSTG